MTTKLAQRRDEIGLEVRRLEAVLANSIAEAAVERGGIAAALAMEELSPEEAGKRRAKIEERITGLRERLDTLREALPVIDQRIAAEAEERRRQEIAKSRSELAGRITDRRRVEATLRKTLVAAEKAAGELVVQRERVDQAVAAVQAALAEDDEPAWAADGDEDWEGDGLTSLQTLLEEGPHTPNAKLAADLAQGAEARERQDRELLRWFSNWPNSERLAALPERLRDSPEVRAAQASYDEQRAQQESRRSEREVERLASLA